MCVVSMYSIQVSVCILPLGLIKYKYIGTRLDVAFDVLKSRMMCSMQSRAPFHFLVLAAFLFIYLALAASTVI